MEDNVTSTKEVLPILSGMAVDKGSRKLRRGRRDGIALQQESPTGREAEGEKVREEKKTTGVSHSHTVQSSESHKPLLYSLIEEGSQTSQYNKYKQFSVKKGLTNANSEEDVGKFEVPSVQPSRTRLIVMDSGKRPLPAPSSKHRLSEKELTAIFEEHDPVQVKLTETGSRKRQLGYVDFASEDEAAAAREALHMTKHGDFTLKLKWENVQSSKHPSTTMQPTMEGYSSTCDDAPELLSMRQVVDMYRSSVENDSWKHPALDQYVSRALKDTETLEQWLADLQPGSRAFRDTQEGLRLVQKSLESNLREAKNCWLEADCFSSYLEHISNCLNNPPAHSMLTEARGMLNEVSCVYLSLQLQ